MKVFVLVALFALVFSKHEEYAGWKSYFVGPFSKEQAIEFNSITDKLKLVVLSQPHLQREGVVLVQPRYDKKFIENLHMFHIKFRVHADDVKKQLDLDDQNIRTWAWKATTKNIGKPVPYNNYQRLSVIYDYMNYIAARHRRTTSVSTAGVSFEGRPIRIMKISSSRFRDTTKPIIFIDAGMHSREWISPPTVTYVIRKLTENVTEPELLEKFDWILIPVVNPDGYEFTFNSSRFWRKTRSNNTHVRSTVCPGVDGNRNFDFLWNSAGTSNDPCSDFYAGSHAFSEPETQTVRNLLLMHSPRIAMYLTMHSYGSMILYPWGHAPQISRNGLRLHSVANTMANAIRSKPVSNLPRYTVGNSVLVLSQKVSGDSEDYVHSLGVPFSYTYELPGLSGRFKGFHLEPQYIEQVCRETWSGISAGVKKAAQYLNKSGQVRARLVRKERRRGRESHYAQYFRN